MHHRDYCDKTTMLSGNLFDTMTYLGRRLIHPFSSKIVLVDLENANATSIPPLQTSVRLKCMSNCITQLLYCYLLHLLCTFFSYHNNNGYAMSGYYNTTFYPETNIKFRYSTALQRM